MCHMNVATILSEMPKPLSRKMRKANVMAVSFEVCMYFAIGVFGYLSTLEITPGLFYQRDKPSAFKNDYLMIVGQIFLAVIVTVGLLCMTLPCRHNIKRLLHRSCDLKMDSNAFHVGLTSLLVAASFLTSVFMPQITELLTFLGAGCPIFCNLLPAMLIATTEK